MSGKFISRSRARSTVAAAAYQSGQALYDRREGDMKSGYSKEEVAATGILSPEGSPEWVKDREELWNRVEAFEDHLIHLKFSSAGKTGEAKAKTDAFREKRLSSAQLASAFICALPRELDLDQNIELVEEYLKERFVSRGFVVDYAIHMEKGNPHVHFMVPLRSLDGNDFAVKKETSYRRDGSVEGESKGNTSVGNIFDRNGLKETRLLWAEVTNRCLERAGFDVRVDARSYMAQGIDMIPTRHRGYNADKIERLGGKSRIVEENREIQLQNLERAFENPAIVLKKVAFSKSVFTKSDVEREIFKMVGGDATSFELLSCKVNEVMAPRHLFGVANDNRIQSDVFLEELEEIASKYADYALESAVEKDTSSVSTEHPRDKPKQDKDISQTVREIRGIKPVPKGIFRTARRNVLNFFKERERLSLLEAARRIEERALYLGIKTRSGEKLYTTPEIREKEARITGMIDRLQGQSFGLQAGEIKPGLMDQLKTKVLDLGSHKSFKHEGSNPFELKDVNGIIASQEKKQGFIYSAQQRAVIHSLIKAGQLLVLSGQAGTGKSTVLKGISAIYSKNGYQVLGTAFQGKVAEALELETGQKAYTLDKLVRAWDTLECHKLDGLDGHLTPKQAARLSGFKLTSKHVVILDEGSMVGDTLWEKLLSRIESSGAKLIVVQDQAQIKSLYGLDIPRYLEEKVGSFALDEVRRQKIEWQREGSQLFNEHRVEQGLSLYDRNHRIIFEKEVKSIEGFDLKDQMISDFLEVYQKSFGKDSVDVKRNIYQGAVMSAMENAQVDDLNARAFGVLLERGDLKNPFKIKESSFAVGARIAFTQNDARERYVKTLDSKDSKTVDAKGVRNGTLGIIESYNEKRGEVRIRLKDGRLVGFNVKDYDSISLAYALSINKLQGSTYARTFNLFNRFMDANKLLVQMTRHREDMKLYVDASIGDIHEMTRFIGGGDRKSLVQDYSLTADQHKIRDKVHAYRDASIKLGEAITLKKDIELNGTKVGPDNPLNQKIQSLLDERKGFALGILDSWKESKIYVAQENLRLETIEVHAGVRERSLSRFEVEAIDRVEEYFKASFEARSLWKEITKTHPGVLAKRHESYAGYRIMREERNALAHAISQNPTLHRGFLRMNPVSKEGIDNRVAVRDQDGFKTIRGTVYPTRLGGMKVILAQGRQYEETLKQSYVTEGLNAERKAFLERVESFKEAGRIVGQGYNQLKDQNTLETGKGEGYIKGAVALKPEVVVSIKEVIKEQRLERDQLALQVVRDLDTHVWASALLEHTGGDNKLNRQLIKHAYLGKLRESLDLYAKFAHGFDGKVDPTSKEGLERETLKKTIGLMVYGDSYLKKDRYAVLKEYGLDPKAFRAHPPRQTTSSGKAVSAANKDGVTNDLDKDTNRLKDPSRGQSEYRLNYKEIRDHLSLDVSGYARSLLGTETSRSGKELIWNRKESKTQGSHTHGSKISLNSLTGQWQDFKTGESGDLMGLTTYVKGGDKHEAYKMAASYLGLDSGIPSKQLKDIGLSKLDERLAARRDEIESQEKEQKVASLKKVQELVERSKPIQGTLAERYLREQRGIQKSDLSTRSGDDLRYLPVSKDIKVYKPALLSIARSKEGDMTACQVTYLDPKTGDKASGVKTPKMSYGRVSYSFVEVQSEEQVNSLEDKIYVAEGVETALSLKEAGIKGRIVAGLGLHNLGKAEHLIKDQLDVDQKTKEPEQGEKTLVIVADNDGVDAPSTKQIQKIVDQYVEKGLNVQVVMPDADLANAKGRDFNDVLKEEGPSRVLGQVEEQLGLNRSDRDLEVSSASAEIEHGTQTNISKSLEEERDEAHIRENTSKTSEALEEMGSLDGKNLERSNQVPPLEGEDRQDGNTQGEENTEASAKTEPEMASGGTSIERDLPSQNQETDFLGENQDDSRQGIDLSSDIPLTVWKKMMDKDHGHYSIKHLVGDSARDGASVEDSFKLEEEFLELTRLCRDLENAAMPHSQERIKGQISSCIDGFKGQEERFKSLDLNSEQAKYRSFILERIEIETFKDQIRGLSFKDLSNAVDSQLDAFERGNMSGEQFKSFMTAIDEASSNRFDRIMDVDNERADRIEDIIDNSIHNSIHNSRQKDFGPEM